MRYLINILIVIIPSLSAAQLDTVLFDKNIEINASRIRGDINDLNVTSIDPLNTDLISGQNLASLIDNKSNIYIRNYGPGSLSTFSIRGSSSAQSIVLWNGIPLTNPMLGTLDLSLINATAFNRVSIQKGGQSTLWGTGAIGGVINLENDSDRIEENKFSSSINIGSFGYNQWSQNLQLRLGKWSTSTLIDYKTALNNFPFKYQENNSQLSNASQESYNIHQNIFFKPNDKSQYKLMYWRNEADRSIPPTVNQSRSLAFQTDESDKILLESKHRFSNSILKSKVAFIKETIIYNDSLIQLFTKNKFESLFFDIQYDKRISSGLNILLGSTINSNKGESIINYNGPVREWQVSFIGGLSYFKNKYDIKISTRANRSDLTGWLWASKASFQLKLFEQLYSTVNISRNFRIPGLNERYWNPGGNPELLPETSIQGDIALIYKPDILRKQKIKISYFRNKIDNWILWAPSNTSFIWEPMNINQIHSEGMEVELNFRFELKDLKISLLSQYDHILSTSQNSLTTPAIDKGDQLWYTPKQNIRSEVSLQYKKITSTYRHRYTSEVTGFSTQIGAFNIGSLHLAYKNITSSGQQEVFFSLDNLWNYNYQVVEFRPMPGRNYRLGFKITVK